MSNDLQQIVPPALPQASASYQQVFENQRSNVFRLFFNKLTTTINSVLSPNYGGRYLYFPVGAFYNDTSQTAAAINTAYAVTFDTAVISKGVSVESDTQITVEYEGLYLVEFTAQAFKSTANLGELWLWLRKNGTDVSHSGREYGIDNQVIPVRCSAIIELAAEDYLEVVYAVGDTNISLTATAASSPVPDIPAAYVEMSYKGNT